MPKEINLIQVLDNKLSIKISGSLLHAYEWPYISETEHKTHAYPWSGHPYRINDGRDNNMLYYTEALQYPEVLFKSESFKFTGNFDTSIDVGGELTFHGITKEIPVKIVLYKDLDESSITRWGKCSFDISLDSFKVKRPSLLMRKISNEISINAELKLLSK